MSENVSNVNETKSEVVSNDVQAVPETMNYEQMVAFTDKFVDDLILSLQEFAYSETHEVIDVVRNNKNSMPISLANQVLARVASFPWRAVNVLMTNVNTNQDEYVVLLNPPTSNNE